MLTIDDLHEHFAKIPKDFNMNINDQEYKCNRNILKAFSKVIASLPDSISTYSIKISTNQIAINTVIDFLHGKNVNLTENSFEIYAVSAKLDIPILKSRLCNEIESSTTCANFETRYDHLQSFPNYCDPLFQFLNNNKSYFDKITKSKQFSLPFSKLFLSSCPTFFTNEDEKANFILSIFECETENPEHDNFSIVSHINLCNLSEETLHLLLTHHFSPQFSPYLKSYPLFKNQINHITDNQKKLSILQKESNEFETTFDNLRETNNSLSNEINKLNSHLFNTEINHYKLKKEIESILSEIDQSNRALEDITQRNNEYLPFLNEVDNMKSTSSKLVDILQNFYNIGGKTIYPGSSRDALKHSKEWNAECVKLRDLIPSIFKEEQLSAYFNILEETRNILCSLIPVKDPSTKRITESSESSSETFSNNKS